MESGDLAGVIIGSIFLLSVALAVVLRGPLGRALARRIEGSAPAADARLDQLEHRLSELEAAQARVVELEERVDFAERMLTSADPAARLPGGDQRA